MAGRSPRALLDPLDPRSLVGRLRRRRWELLEQRFPGVTEMRVLDLGGWMDSWRALPGHPREVVTLNLERQAPPAEAWARCVQGDACSPPPGVLDELFDLVYSNSLVEHLGGHERRRAFAHVVRSAAPHHWVQTPYRYFPIEPHWLFPGLQFLPVALRAGVAARWPYGHMGSGVEDVLSVELLTVTEMRHYFPASDLLRERFLGLTKSLIAVR